MGVKKAREKHSMEITKSTRALASFICCHLEFIKSPILLPLFPPPKFLPKTPIETHPLSFST
jgi:hypothetical protein